MGEVVIGTDFVRGQTALERERCRHNIRKAQVKRQELAFTPFEKLVSGKHLDDNNDDGGGRAA